MNMVPFSPLTVDSLVGAAIHVAAFGGASGYVLAMELADAVAVRTGREFPIAHNAYASYISVGVRS